MIVAAHHPAQEHIEALGRAAPLRRADVLFETLLVRVMQNNFSEIFNCIEGICVFIIHYNF